MDVTAIIASAYRFFEERRGLLYSVTALLVLIGLLASTNIRTEENIEAMLPDGSSRIVGDFRLLQQAPFARKVIITLQAEGETGIDSLTAAADRLAVSLDPALFKDVTTGPDTHMHGRLLVWIEEALPSILNADDLEIIAADLAGDGVPRRLGESYELLLGPEGWAMKDMIRRDPFSLYKMGLEKLRHVNLVPQMKLVDNHFVSADGKSVMLIAETPVKMTDSAGSRNLVTAFNKAVKTEIPVGMRATMVSGHQYTLANAEAVKGDLWRILTASTLAILALFVVFMRSLRASLVFLLPLAVICIAAVAVSLFFPMVSALTIGFGGVLLGITVDYGIHVYFAMRRGDALSHVMAGRVARPVIFGGLTTLAAFAVLLFSDLPGTRQIAVFSIAGICTALLLSLLVLPHLMVPAKESENDAAGNRWMSWIGRRRCLVLAVWIFLVVLCGWQAAYLKFNGDLRHMSLVPPELAADEKNLRTTWGDFRGQAMIWIESPDAEQAFALNGRLFSFLRKELSSPFVTLAPLLPSDEEQRANRTRWSDFWQGKKGQRILADLRVQAAAMGFSANAFTPFENALHGPLKPVTLKGIQEAGLGRLAESLVMIQDGKTSLLTLAPDQQGLPELVEKQFSDGVRVVSQSRFRREISDAIGDDFLRFFLLSLVTVGLFLVILFRWSRKALVAAAPALTGVVMMMGIMGALGLELNIFNVVAGILVVGLGIDYGIFMVCMLTGKVDHSTSKAVLVSGLTTLAGFGSLVLARHPALHSIGLSVLLGIGGAIITALLVVPALLNDKMEPEQG
ncbi:MAG: MMPL family transporter [Nitrospirota bacterium]|nr:MMPL family transporter [Nitrospirota bacterium]